MNKSIDTAVIYHYSDNGYTTHILRRATVHTITKTVTDGNGFVHADLQKIRIFTNKELQISNGDYIFACTFAESKRAPNNPDKQRCRKVVAFSDNRVGRYPHWRIEAE